MNRFERLAERLRQKFPDACSGWSILGPVVYVDIERAGRTVGVVKDLDSLVTPDDLAALEAEVTALAEKIL